MIAGASSAIGTSRCASPAPDGFDLISVGIGDPADLDPEATLAKVEYSDYPQKEDGSVDAPVTFKFDIKGNKAG